MGEYGEQGERERRLIATISGKRTSAGLPSVLEALEKAKAALVDIRQFIVQDEFTLTLVIELSDEEGQRETDIVKELLLCAHAMKLFVEFDVVQNRVVSEPGQVGSIYTNIRATNFVANANRDVLAGICNHDDQSRRHRFQCIPCRYLPSHCHVQRKH
uniref:ACT domain-containing protein n=1 Tax=Rhodosorus marinus TaxID=101924 RepID=A0A7S2ZTV7_9RHOD|mmetsp:Transcript_31552/g.122199  ORF Transcript_31552/g.122199 Transcript_31552/m.122199 type:complete len:158 (+) Transcript_31552:95-568(+)